MRDLTDENEVGSVTLYTSKNACAEAMDSLQRNDNVGKWPNNFQFMFFPRSGRDILLRARTDRKKFSTDRDSRPRKGVERDFRCMM